jgi:hypothetical protein
MNRPQQRKQKNIQQQRQNALFLVFLPSSRAGVEKTVLGCFYFALKHFKNFVFGGHAHADRTIHRHFDISFPISTRGKNPHETLDRCENTLYITRNNTHTCLGRNGEQSYMFTKRSHLKMLRRTFLSERICEPRLFASSLVSIRIFSSIFLRFRCTLVKTDLNAQQRRFLFKIIKHYKKVLKISNISRMPMPAARRPFCLLVKGCHFSHDALL